MYLHLPVTAISFYNTNIRPRIPGRNGRQNQLPGFRHLTPLKLPFIGSGTVVSDAQHHLHTLANRCVPGDMHLFQFIEQRHPHPCPLFHSANIFYGQFVYSRIRLCHRRDVRRFFSKSVTIGTTPFINQPGSGNLRNEPHRLSFTNRRIQRHF